ncbi:MAG: MBL fold metallo-hydrolase [Clostridiales bacterium]|nr:MBL fold metallo-hydrolase [Clostridiales bacterium]
MIKLCPLFSSSSGNCTFIGDEKGGILIDIGVTCRKTENALKAVGVDPRGISAVFVTHEHSDHIAGIKVFASKYNVPVYASLGTLQGMNTAGCFKPGMKVMQLMPGGIEERDMFIKPFEISHDAAEPTGYTVTLLSGAKYSVCTDLGFVPDKVKNSVSGSSEVLLESNHDVNLLKIGGYPPFLKRRILSDKGHLSNDACAEFASELIACGTKRIILGHLSRENNLPPLARETTRNALEERGAKEGTDYLLEVAKP